MTEERTTTPAEIDEALSRRISDALNSEDGIAGDPDLAAILATDPKASVHAKHLARVGRWLAMWPVETPSEPDFEALAAKIDARLGESFEDDFSLPPEFESETPSRPPTEEGKASIARIPLRRSPRSTITELSVIRNDPRSSDEEISLETLAIAAATQPLSQPFTLPKSAELAEKANDAVAEQPSLEEVVIPMPVAAKPSVRPVSVPPPATKSERPKPAIVPKPRAAEAPQKLAPPSAPKAAPPPTPKLAQPAKPDRSWWPGLLAAAAVGLGAIGVASVTMNQAAPDSEAPLTAPAMAVEMVAPAAAPVAVAPPPMPAPPTTPEIPEPVAAAAPTSGGFPAESADYAVAEGGTAVPARRVRASAPIDHGIGGGGPIAAVREIPRAPAATPASAPMPARPATTASTAPTEIAPSTPRGAPSRQAASEPSAELSRETVASVMQGLLPEVSSCANGRRGTIPVDVIVQPNGHVTGATVTGSFQGTPEGSCIARAVRSAQFPAHDGDEPTRFRYPYAL